MRLSAPELRVALARLDAIPAEMGVILQRASFSPNIKERMDASCALFADDGTLLAQAEHQPVHLGSLPLTVEVVLRRFASRWEPGDVVMTNHPALGGSHLPDVTLLSPVFDGSGRQRTLQAIIVNRAHHADVGGSAPGSMDPSARTLAHEGTIIEPTLLLEQGQEVAVAWEAFCTPSRTPRERVGDLRAQVSANILGVRRLQTLIERAGVERFSRWNAAVVAYAAGWMERGLALWPEGRTTAEASLELPVAPGAAATTAHLQVEVRHEQGRIHIDFDGTDPQLDNALNAPRSVTVACCAYVAKTLFAPQGPTNGGTFAPLRIDVPAGSLLDPSPDAAVAAGNVETSQVVVEMLFDALAALNPAAVPAQSQGTMNNLLIGGPIPPGSMWSSGGTRAFSYYETIGGGAGGAPSGPGASATQVHMTNTANTPIEALEASYPLRVVRAAVRRGSGGAGTHVGGEGIIREIEILGEVATVTFLGQHRRIPPRGRKEGGDGALGSQWVVSADGSVMVPLPNLSQLTLLRGQRVRIVTPGGGGWGRATDHP